MKPRRYFTVVQKNVNGEIYGYVPYKTSMFVWWSWPANISDARLWIRKKDAQEFLRNIRSTTQHLPVQPTFTGVAVDFSFDYSLTLQIVPVEEFND